jgi:WD40 repeat protein
VTRNQKLREFGRGFHALAFSPDGKVLATLENDQIQLWDAETGKKKATLEGHKDRAAITMLAFSPDGKTLASGSVHAVTLWNPASGKVTRTFPLEMQAACLAFSPDGKTLAVGGPDGESHHRVELCDVVAGKTTTLFKEAAGDNGGWVRSLVYTPDGKMLITQAGLHKIVLRSAVSGRPELSLEAAPTAEFARPHLDPPASDLDKRGPLPTIAISPDGRTLAAGGNTIRLWTLPAGRKK